MIRRIFIGTVKTDLQMAEAFVQKTNNIRRQCTDYIGADEEALENWQVWKYPVIDGNGAYYIIHQTELRKEFVFGLNIRVLAMVNIPQGKICVYVYQEDKNMVYQYLLDPAVGQERELTKMSFEAYENILKNRQDDIKTQI